jgi:hypothetical protein
MGKKKGFRRKPKGYRLHFEGEEYEGLEVSASSLSLEKFLQISGLAAKVGAPGGVVSEEEAKEMFRTFAGSLIEWNLEEEDGTAIPAKYAICRLSGEPGEPGTRCSAHDNDQATEEPCSYTGVVDQELGFILTMVMAWMSAISDVAPPLPPGSSDTETSPAPPVPMEVLSPSLTN